MSLTELIHELFDDTGETLYSELARPTRQRLTAAFILEDDSDIAEVLLTLPTAYHALIFSQMAGPIDNDPSLDDFQYMFRNAAIVYYADQIQDEMDRIYPAWETERETCHREAQYDDYRTAL